MIFDSLNHLMQYEKLAPAAWEKISKFLRTCTEKTPAGRYEIDGDRVYASLQSYETHEPDSDKLEIHRKYVDIQLLLAGKESILCSPVDGLKETVPYDGGKDIAFYRAAEGNSVTVTLEPGTFAVFFPEEGHMPGLSCSGVAREVVKVVVKIAVTEF